ncbi:hypothetical protein LTR27_003761 [Elasticomyces elasticus]|nr:hypothetical protein LTR27_003761 [Elasticomyces elasticus]
MSVHEVLDLPELLECILLNLPIRDLLFSQKVCRRWKAVVDSSRIQKALFFIPGTAKDISYVATNNMSTIAWRAACVRLGIRYSDGDEYRPAQHCLQNDVRTIRQDGYAINPLLITYASCHSFYLNPELWGQRDAGTSSFSVPSWTRMFLTQPPGSTHVRKSMERVYYNPRYPGRDSVSERVLIDVLTQRGDTFGILVERYHREVEEFIMRRGKGKWRAREKMPGGVVSLVSAWLPGDGEKRDGVEARNTRPDSDFAS